MTYFRNIDDELEKALQESLSENSWEGSTEQMWQNIKKHLQQQVQPWSKKIRTLALTAAVVLALTLAVWNLDPNQELPIEEKQTYQTNQPTVSIPGETRPIRKGILLKHADLKVALIKLTNSEIYLEIFIHADSDLTIDDTILIQVRASEHSETTVFTINLPEMSGLSLSSGDSASFKVSFPRPSQSGLYDAEVKIRYMVKNDNYEITGGDIYFNNAR
ncbi:MAG: hypothetical protein KGZ63_12710 [Clostridiales bacterium]|nr:hypothetical protein [Clostridiales bacterium]